MASLFLTEKVTGADTSSVRTCTDHHPGLKAKAKASKTNRKRSEATKEQPRTEDGLWQNKEAGGGTSSATTREPKEHKSRTAKAKASKTNRGTVERMDRLERERPDLADKVVTGELPAAAAIRNHYRRTVTKNRPPWTHHGGRDST